MLASVAWPARAAELTASGPSECADADELVFRVERNIGMPLAQAAPLSFDVAMEQTASGYAARIVVDAAAPAAPHLTRELSAADCGKLVDAVSVAVALALGMAEPPPEAASPASEHTAAAADAAPSPSVVAASEVSDGGDDTSSAAANGGLTPSIALSLLGDAGSLPNPSLGAALGAALGWRKLELRALGTLLFEQEKQLDSPRPPSPGAKLQLVTGGLLACTAPFGSLRASLSPFACLGAEVGELSGVGTGVASPRRGGTLWVAPLAQAGATWLVPHTALRLVLSLLAATPLTRDQFALRDIGTVHRPPSVVGRLSIGISIGFD